MTVKWSNSTIFGIVLNRFWKLAICHRIHSKPEALHDHVVTNLLEVVTQLDDWGGIEHTSFVQDELTVFERVDIALDQQQVRATLYW